MHKDEVSVRDELPVLSGGIGTSCAFRKFANIAQAMDSKKGPAAFAAVSKLRPRL